MGMGFSLSVLSPCYVRGGWWGLQASGHRVVLPFTPGESLLHDDLTSFYALLLLSL